ncbi:type IX secretion/gliding motility protein PorT/SprT [Filimonas effusa]|uniref:PorT family protein n=1 Tax=Filimonas effusa TaxID=2508721 RepID=A0A4Q1D0B9_9BACT|nr:outer membrane beta-barrel protein [Filimonas effusa]RXK81169.1 PorT family protein [Filimonas effusa]
MAATLKKTVLFPIRILTAILLVLVATLAVHAQTRIREGLNRPDHDSYNYYFGISLAYNTSYIHTSKNPHFLANDSILVAEPGAKGGIALGLLATLRLNQWWELRGNPQLIIGGAKYFTYTLKNPNTVFGEKEIETRQMPSTIVSFPFHFKFSSDRIGNFRTYLLAGMKYDIDLASNSAARNAENLVKLKKYDYGIDVGIGFNFYLRFVTLSPEIRFSSGLANIHSRDANLKYSSVFDKLQSRMIFFTLNLED